MIRPYENLQQVFDACYIGLAKQGFEQSVDDLGDCQYRGEHNRKCGIGHVVPDELCKDDLNGTSIDSAIALDPDWAKLFENIPNATLSDLQACHDLQPYPLDMQQALHSFAGDNNLTIPEIPS